MKQTPVSIQNPNAKSAMAFEKMAYSLMDKDYDSVVVKRGMAAFFSHIVAGNYQGKIIN
jgi:flagellar biosynthesis protein FlhG